MWEPGREWTAERQSCQFRADPCGCNCDEAIAHATFGAEDACLGCCPHSALRLLGLEAEDWGPVSGRTGRGDDRHHGRFGRRRRGHLDQSLPGQPAPLGTRGMGTLLAEHGGRHLVHLSRAGFHRGELSRLRPRHGHPRIAALCSHSLPSSREFPTVTELIAGDLGIPCQHQQTTRWMRNRLFGGCLWGECFIGTHRFSDPPWYPPCARDAVRSWATEDPNFIRNFRVRVIEGRDPGYVRTLVVRMYDACPVDQLPANPYPEYQRAARPHSPLPGERNR